MGHALLLAAGKHIRTMMHPGSEADRFQHFRGFLFGDSGSKSNFVGGFKHKATNFPPIGAGSTLGDLYD